MKKIILLTILTTFLISCSTQLDLKLSQDANRVLIEQNKILKEQNKQLSKELNECKELNQK